MGRRHMGPTIGKLPSNHAEILLPLIQTLFETTGVTVQQLSGIAVSIGPGSFTGLRIGLATAKGLAYESGVPLVGVSTLHANAARVRRGDALIGSMLDARKSEVYVALFRRGARRSLAGHGRCGHADRCRRRSSAKSLVAFCRRPDACRRRRKSS